MIPDCSGYVCDLSLVPERLPQRDVQRKQLLVIGRVRLGLFVDRDQLRAGLCRYDPDPRNFSRFQYGSFAQLPAELRIRFHEPLAAQPGITATPLPGHQDELTAHPVLTIPEVVEALQTVLVFFIKADIPLDLLHGLTHTSLWQVLPWTLCRW